MVERVVGKEERSRNRAKEGRGGRGRVREMWKSGREGQKGSYSKEVHGWGGRGGSVTESYGG